jgi:two-component system invasion response regulator UvrY
VAGPQVLLADDHPVVLEGMRALLKGHCELVGTVGDGPTLVAAALALRPEIIVADISMPGFGGIEAVRRLRSAGVTAKVIMLTMHVDTDLMEEALAAGANGYLIKHSAGEELIHAIHEVSRGVTYVSSWLGPRRANDR